MSMKERMRARFEAKQAEQKAIAEAKKLASRPRRRGASKVASREEQYARYLDCGPLAWDDRDNPDY